MLNPSRVLNYVKDNLAFPFHFIELDDTKIMNYIQTYTLREFSYYFPDIKKMPLNLDLDMNKVPGRQNEFYLYEPEGLEILNIKDIYFPMGSLILFGHPPLGPLTYGELKDFALAVETSVSVKQFSSFDYTFEFIHPNVVRISPVPNNTGTVTVEYERIQPSDFRMVSNEFQVLFCELALADIMILIGRIRKRYADGTLKTPFGEIPLSADILDEGKEKKRELIEKMTAGSLPNVTLDIG